jgi:nucleotide-binding universal stress UspA family protein
MSALRCILVPVEDSDSSLQAVDLAVALGRTAGAALVFCHAVDLTGAVSEANTPYVDSDMSGIFDAFESQSKQILAGATARAVAAGVASSSAELAGPPAGAILDAVGEHAADAIVMGTHGRAGLGRVFLGSTAESVLRRAGVPVFVVSERTPPLAQDAAPFARIAVAYDGSEAAGAAFTYALELAKPGTTTLLLANVLDARDQPDATAARTAAAALLTAATARAMAQGVVAESAILEGEPVESLLDAAQSRGADLIAIGTHGRRGLQRLLFGSVAEGVVRAAAVPVVVVHQGVAAATDAPSPG